VLTLILSLNLYIGLIIPYFSINNKTFILDFYRLVLWLDLVLMNKKILTLLILHRTRSLGIDVGSRLLVKKEKKNFMRLDKLM